MASLRVLGFTKGEVSALLLGESIEGSMVLGGAMAVLGTAVMNWGRRPAV